MEFCDGESLAAIVNRAPLPGNVRQLRAIVQRALALPRVTRDHLDLVIGPSEPDLPEREDRLIDESRLRDALTRHRFQLAAAARELGVSRMHLDALIARSTSLRKAKDLDRDEIEACRRDTGGDLDRMAEKLEVSPRGLRLRMTQLGLD